MGTAPAGWYTDGSGALRWWDGAAWTAHLASTPPAPVPAAPVAQPVLRDGAWAARSAYDAVGLSTWSDPSARFTAPAVASPAPAATAPASWQAPPPNTVAAGFTPVFAPPTTLARTTSAGPVGGWLMLLGGLGLLAFGVTAFLYASAHGYLSTGGLVTGSILTIRGVMRIRESRGAGLTFSTLTAPSPMLIGMLAVVGLLIAGGTVMAVRASSGPRPLLDQPLTGVGPTGAWPAGYTAVGTEAAYRRLSSTSLPCAPGFRCSEVLVLSRTACRLPGMEVRFMDADGRPLNSATGIGFQGSGPNLPVSTTVSTADPAAAYFTITAFTCRG